MNRFIVELALKLEGTCHLRIDAHRKYTVKLSLKSRVGVRDVRGEVCGVVSVKLAVELAVKCAVKFRVKFR